MAKNNNNNNNNPMESIKSLIESIKQSIMEKMDCDFDSDSDIIAIDKNKVLNDLSDCGLDLIKTKRLFSAIADCVNKWKMENNPDLRFDYIYKLSHCADYIQYAIDSLNGFIDKNRKN